MAVTGDPKWHERTPTLLAASVAALAAIGLIVWLTMFVVRQATTTEPAPLEYMTPFSDSSSTTDALVDHHLDDHQHPAAGDDRHHRRHRPVLVVGDHIVISVGATVAHPAVPLR